MHSYALVAHSRTCTPCTHINTHAHTSPTSFVYTGAPASAVEGPIPLTQYRRKDEGPVVAPLRSERHFDLMLGGGSMFVAVDKKGVKVGVASWEDAVAAHRKGMRLQAVLHGGVE